MPLFVRQGKQDFHNLYIGEHYKNWPPDNDLAGGRHQLNSFHGDLNGRWNIHDHTRRLIQV